MDGNLSISSIVSDSDAEYSRIPVIISQRKNPENKSIKKPVLKTIKRNNAVLESLELPTVMNINPRSMYNKTEDFHLLLDQYEADVICVSESWERENYSLKDLLKLTNYEVITNVVQRDFGGGKPAIIINLEYT